MGESPFNLKSRTIPPMRHEAFSFTDVVCERTASGTAEAPDFAAFVHDHIPVTVPPHTKRVIKLDAGELICGYLRLALAGGSGARITFMPSECYAYPQPPQQTPFAFNLFRALEKTGLYEKADKVWDLWRHMVTQHLTTCVENETEGRSDCHAWGSVILYELPAVYLGVRPVEPGCDKILVHPTAGHLTEASGQVITPKGEITVSWVKSDDGACDLTVKAPGSDWVL